jgi:hypothetical protein
MKTVIKKCDCKSDYQDKQYGQGNRVHNVKGAKGKEDTYSCTVCGKERRYG